MTDSIKTIPWLDQRRINGEPEIVESEPPQIVQIPSIPEPPQPTSVEKVLGIYTRAQDVLDKISDLTQRIDEKCSHLSTATGEPKGSRLFQAMMRIFRERTTTIKYDHYKQALEIRQQLQDEDAVELRKKS